ncbi:MAG: tetratricopeptide repeat protein, partial [Victivallales bacterium]|nr:tetratricopeptide repeat protein [Victivallales bacterium]
DDLKKSINKIGAPSVQTEALQREIAVLKQQNAALSQAAASAGDATIFRQQLQAQKKENESLQRQMDALKLNIAREKQQREKELKAEVTRQRNIQELALKLEERDKRLAQINAQLERTGTIISKLESQEKANLLANKQLKEALDKKNQEYDAVAKELKERQTAVTAPVAVDANAEVVAKEKAAASEKAVADADAIAKAATEAKDKAVAQAEEYRKKVENLEKELKSIYTRQDMLIQKSAALARENMQLKSTAEAAPAPGSARVDMFEKLNDKYNLLLKENSQKQSEINELNKAHAALVSAHAELKKSIKKNSSAPDDATQKELNQKLQKATLDLKKIQDQYSVISTENQKLLKFQTEYEKLKEQYDKLSEVREKYIKVTAELKKIQDQYAVISTENQKLLKFQTEYEKLKEQYDKLSEVREKYIKATADSAAYKRMQIEYSKKVEELKALKKLKEDNTGLNQKLTSIRQELEKSTAASTETSKQLNSLKVENTSLKGKIRSLEDALKAVNTASGTAEKVPAQSREERIKTVVYLLEAAFNSEQQNDYQSAIWHYRKLLKLAPDNFTANRSLARLLLLMNKDEEAREYFEKAHAINKNSPEVLYGLAELSIRGKSYDTATAFLERANVMDPDSAAGFLLKAKLFAAQNNDSQALAELKKAVEKEAGFKEALMMSANLLAQGDKTREEARQYYQRAISAGAERNRQLEEKLGMEMPGNNAPDKKPASVAFMLKSAQEAMNKKDYISAKWFYEQLLTVQPENAAKWKSELENVARLQKSGDGSVEGAAKSKK